MDMSKFVKNEKKKVLDIPDLEAIDKTEMYYFDALGNACDEDEAVRFVAKTYDKNGKVINESWGTCVAKEKKGKSL